MQSSTILLFVVNFVVVNTKFISSNDSLYFLKYIITQSFCFKVAHANPMKVAIGDPIAYPITDPILGPIYFPIFFPINPTPITPPIDPVGPIKPFGPINPIRPIAMAELN